MIVHETANQRKAYVHLKWISNIPTPSKQVHKGAFEVVSEAFLIIKPVSHSFNVNILGQQDNCLGSEC